MQYYSIPIDEITKYLDAKSNRGKISKTQIEFLRNYYTIKMKDYHDVITAIDIQLVTGFSKEIIRKWIKRIKSLFVFPERNS